MPDRQEGRVAIRPRPLWSAPARHTEQSILGRRWGAGETSSQRLWWSRDFTDMSFYFTKATLIKCYIISLQLESCNALIIRYIFGEKKWNQDTFWKFNRGTTVPRCSSPNLILYFIYIYKKFVYHVIYITLSLLDDCVPINRLPSYIQYIAHLHISESPIKLFKTLVICEPC